MRRRSPGPAYIPSSWPLVESSADDTHEVEFRSGPHHAAQHPHSEREGPAAEPPGPRIGNNTLMWIAWYWAFPQDLSFLQQLGKLVGGQLAVSEDSVKQTGADGLARVHRHDRAPAILVTQEAMAAFHAKNAKACPFQHGNEVGASDAEFPLMPRRSRAGCQRTPTPAPARPRLRDIALWLRERAA